MIGTYAIHPPQVVYDGLVMLLGPSSLQIDAPGRLDALRKKLRGLTLLDTLIMDDSLVPCVMLEAPQVREVPGFSHTIFLLMRKSKCECDLIQVC